ncbi:MAG TPA: hypothetical protein VFO65_11915, partial [Acidimicrobiales bacterium]|nr:hypothetical protein [Acidimicrobiales bacterium]
MATRGPAHPMRAMALAVLGLVVGVAVLVAIGFEPGAVVPLVVLSLPFVWILGRKPVLRRLAVRNAMRRPRETV